MNSDMFMFVVQCQPGSILPPPDSVASLVFQKHIWEYSFGRHRSIKRWNNISDVWRKQVTLPCNSDTVLRSSAKRNWQEKWTAFYLHWHSQWSFDNIWGEPDNHIMNRKSSFHALIERWLLKSLQEKVLWYINVIRWWQNLFGTFFVSNTLSKKKKKGSLLESIVKNF